MTKFECLIAAVVLAAACDKAASEGTETGASDSAGSSTSGGSGGPMCPEHPHSSCAPIDCATAFETLGYRCGPLELFDETGCMRPRCASSEDCGAEETCHFFLDTCVPAEVTCDGDGTCGCGGDADCSRDVGVCVEAT